MLTYDLDKRGNKTMYEYLYELIKEDIADGKLKADEKLPSKRGFSQHLQISVKTVENAYEQLLLEGYIRSEEKRGYYVNKIAVVTGGVIVEHGDPHEVIDHPKEERTRQFLTRYAKG